MKKIAIIIALFMLMASASCAPFKQREAEPPQPSASEPAQQSSPLLPELQVYIDGSIDPENATIDPIYEDGKINSILALCFDGLFKFGEDAAGNAVTELCLAESYTVDENRIYSFSLKPEVTFNNGTAVTAGDWVWSFERLKNTSESPWLAYADMIESVESPSPERLVITLKEPRADFESVLALPCFAVQSKKHFDEVGAEKYVTEPMGSGAFYILSWKIRERYTLENRLLRDSNVTFIDFRVINDPELRFEKLGGFGVTYQSDTLNICVSPPPDKLSSVEAAENLKLETFPTAEQRYVCFNVTKAPFDNPQVRRALRMAADKDEMLVKDFSGQGEKTHNVFMGSSLYFNGDIADEGFDVDRAQALLTEAGYPDGFSCEMLYNAENDAAARLTRSLSEQWARIGVEMEAAALDPSELTVRLSELSYDVATVRWADETNDPAAFASFIASYDVSKGFYTGYNNPDLSYLAAAAAGADTPDERESCYRQIQQLLYDDCPLFPVYREATAVIMHKQVEGFKLTKLGYFDFDNLQYK